jgi:hypothetical protein
MLELLDKHRAVVLQLLLPLLLLHACCTGALTCQQATHAYLSSHKRAANHTSNSPQARPRDPPGAPKATSHPCSMRRANISRHTRTAAPRPLSLPIPHLAGSCMTESSRHVDIVLERLVLVGQLETPHRAVRRHRPRKCACHRTPIEPRSTQRARPHHTLVHAQATEGQLLAISAPTCKR